MAALFPLAVKLEVVLLGNPVISSSPVSKGEVVLSSESDAFGSGDHIG